MAAGGRARRGGAVARAAVTEGLRRSAVRAQMPAGANPTERGALHVLIGIGIAAGIAVGAVLALLAVQAFGVTGVGKARRIYRQLVEDAEREAEAVRREAQIESREQAGKLRADIDSELADRRRPARKSEERVR